MNDSRNVGGGAIGVLVVIIAAVAGLIVSFKLAPALFWILLWVVIGIVVLLIGLIVVLVIVANKSSGEKDERTAAGIFGDNLDEEQKAIIVDARKKLMEVRRAIAKIHAAEVRSSANDVCAQLDKITKTLQEKPEKIKSTRQCLNYYIPTLKDVLAHFADLEKKEQMSEEMTGKTTAFLKNVNTALEKQYDGLFDADKLDMEVDMEAMQIAIKRDGLL